MSLLAAVLQKDRKAAADLYVLFTNRGGDANVKLLEELLRLRGDQAKLLGYKTWADYILEERMAKDPKTVASFIESLKGPRREEG